MELSQVRGLNDSCEDALFCSVFAFLSDKDFMGDVWMILFFTLVRIWYDRLRLGGE